MHLKLVSSSFQQQGCTCLEVFFDVTNGNLPYQSKLMQSMHRNHPGQNTLRVTEILPGKDDKRIKIVCPHSK